MKLSVIIPCYNEKKTISNIIERVNTINLPRVTIELIVVNDGSNDSSGQILETLKKRFNFKLFHHRKNLGKGQAIKTALNFVSGDYVIIQDADLEYDPKDYEKLLNCAMENNAKIVYGSRRFHSENKYSYLSFYLGGKFLDWLANILYDTKITDISTGYKLFKAEILKNLNLNSKGFEFCPEVTAKIAKQGIKIYEVPINYYPRSREEGKKIKWWDGVKMAWILIKYKFFD